VDLGKSLIKITKTIEIVTYITFSVLVCVWHSVEKKIKFRKLACTSFGSLVNLLKKLIESSVTVSC